MSNKKKQNSQKLQEKKQTYRNPVDTLGGKILIWVLIVAMLSAVIFGLITVIDLIF